jgi:hypothetical protein
MEAQKANFASLGSTAPGPENRACAMWAWTKAPSSRSRLEWSAPSRVG